MKTIFTLFIGIILSFGALWVGTYAAELYPFGHWMHMPIVITATCAGACGLILLLDSFANL